MITNLNDWLSILPALALIIGALASAGVSTFVRREWRQAAGEGVCYLALAGALAAVLWRIYSDRPVESAFNGAVVLDLLAVVLSLGVIAATGLMLVLTGDQVRQRGMPPGEFGALALLSAAGMVVLVQSTDLITFFVALEILSLGVYVLSGYFRKEARSNEASIKYFLMGAFATGFLLYGMTLLYGATGSVELEGIHMGLTGPRGPAAGLAPLGFVLIAVGLAFKVGAVPFHMWVPDVYEGAPTSVTAFMSVAVKASAFGAFLRVFLTAGETAADVWGGLLVVLALATMVVGNFLAVWQQSVKRMLAYSSIAHTGYVLVAMAVLRNADRSLHEEAGAGAVFYLFAYTFMTLGAFAFVLCAGRDGKDAEHLDDYAGLAKRRPWLAAAMTIFMVSLAGIPPTAGFLGKFLIFKAAVTAGDYALVVVGVLTSAVSAYYYLRVVAYMYMHPETASPGEPAPANVTMVVAVTAVFTLLLGLIPSKILELSYRSIGPFVP